MSIIILCYNRRNIVRIDGRMPHIFTLHIYEIIMACLSHVVSACVFNESISHWLLFNAL